MAAISDLANLSIGIYVLLLLLLSYNFLLAIRVRQLRKEFTAYQKTAEDKAKLIDDRLKLLVPERSAEKK